MRIIALSSGWLLGLYAASRLDLPMGLLIAGVAIALLGLVLVRRRWRWRWLLAALALAGLLAGGMRIEVDERTAAGGALASLNEAGDIELKGVVVSYPESGNGVTRFQLAVREVRVRDAWEETSGKVLVTAKATRELALLREPPFFRQGDLFWLKGRHALLYPTEEKRPPQRR